MKRDTKDEKANSFTIKCRKQQAEKRRKKIYTKFILVFGQAGFIKVL